MSPATDQRGRLSSLLTRCTSRVGVSGTRSNVHFYSPQVIRVAEEIAANTELDEDTRRLARELAAEARRLRP